MENFLYPYYNQWAGIEASPYKRFGVPIRSLKFDNLPLEFQQNINLVVFSSLHFSECQEIQPIEHLECYTWGNTKSWLDTKREREEWKDVDEEDFAEYG